MTTVIFWFMFAVAVGVWASNRGRSGIGWFFLSLIISPLLGAIFLAVTANRKADAAAPGAPNASTHTRCPKCAEFVLPQATVCKHCGTELQPDLTFHTRVAEQKDSAERTDRTNLLIGIAFIVGLIVVANAISKW